MTTSQEWAERLGMSEPDEPRIVRPPRILEEDSEERFLMLEAMILSGQVPDDRIQAMFKSSPAFEAWLRARIAARHREAE